MMVNDPPRSNAPLKNTPLKNVPLENVPQLAMLAVDALDNGVMIFDSQLRMVYLNNWVQESCVFVEPPLEMEFSSVFPKMKSRRVHRAIAQCIKFGLAKKIATKLLKQPFPFFQDQDITKVIKQSISIYPLEMKGAYYAYVEIQNVTHTYNRERELQAQALHLQRLANFDPLTGLMNRRFFTEQLAVAVDRSVKQGTRFSLLVLDLDKFKSVNDNYGHNVGDELLRRTSAELKKLLVGNDVIGRIGGDEFVILLDDVLHEEQPAMLAGKILSLFNEKWSIMERHLKVGTSIGIAMFPEDGTHSGALLKHADLAMYSAKQLGSGKFQFYSSAMGNNVLHRIELENDLRMAIEKEEFELYFQPQVDIDTGKIHGCEALIRWNHPEKGNILPMDFIPVAEESMLIVALGKWVIEESIRFLKVMNEKGLHCLMAINLSPCQFEAITLFDVLANAIKENEVNPEMVVLEITEGHLIQSRTKTDNTLRRLKMLGVKVALDDFGTGYSSLAYLKTLPLDFLKIDRLFVKDLVQDLVDQKIIASVVELAQALDLEIVAEGAETPEQVAKLQILGCGVIQGFYYSKPMPGDELIEYCLNF